MSIVGPILVTGSAGRLGAVGRTVVEVLRLRGLPVRALVPREDKGSDALRAIGPKSLPATSPAPGISRVPEGLPADVFRHERLSALLGSDSYRSCRCARAR
jgi:hypothetical protein